MIEFTVHHYFHSASMEEIRSIKESLATLLSQGKNIMATLDEVLAEVTDENTKLDSVNALITGLKQQITDALSGANLPPSVQAKVDAVFNGLSANKAKIATALDANVPPSGVPPVGTI